MDIPTIVLPPVETIETISIPLPTADVPSYIPLVVPPSDLQEPEGAKPVETAEPPKPTLPPPFPPVQDIETISIPLPTADVPSYVPLVVPPSDLQEPKGTKPVETAEPPAPTLPPPFPPYKLPTGDLSLIHI